MKQYLSIYIFNAVLQRKPTPGDHKKNNSSHKLRMHLYLFIMFILDDKHYRIYNLTVFIEIIKIKNIEMTNIRGQKVESQNFLDTVLAKPES